MNSHEIKSMWRLIWLVIAFGIIWGAVSLVVHRQVYGQPPAVIISPSGQPTFIQPTPNGGAVVIPPSGAPTFILPAPIPGLMPTIPVPLPMPVPLPLPVPLPMEP